MKSNVSSKVIGFFCIILLILSLVVVFMTSQATSKYNEQVIANSSKIGDLSEQVAKLKASVDEVITEEIASNNVKSCADLGNAVAEYQTKYQHMSASQDYDMWMENVYALDACFDETWKESRIPWYFGDPSYDLEWKWTFQSTYEFVNKKINVLWLCHDVATGDLLVYTTGIYDSETGLFSDIKYVRTSIGEKYLYAVPDSEGTESTNPVDDDNNGEDSDSEYNPDGDYTVDASGEPDGIGGGGVHGDGNRADADNNTDKFGNDMTSEDTGFNSDDYQDYDDYIGSDEP